ncbi:unnamed protein product [Chrysoparadoxa australica]
MVTWSGKTIKDLSFYTKASSRRGILGFFGVHYLPFIVLYAWTLQRCFLTIGEQYQEALAVADDVGLDLPNSESHRRAELNALLAGDEVGESIAVKTIRLPWEYLPGFWPLLYLGIVVILNLLMVLLQHWSVAFRQVGCWIQCRPAKDAREATHVKVVPASHLPSAKTLLVPIERTMLGACFEFHRRTYVYNAESDSFVKIRCPTNMPLSFFLAWRGLQGETAIDQARTMFGPNKFEMATPKFVDLYKQQVLSPFTIFQLFTTGLWLLDNYWQYSMFTLVMILVFEATVVMQRLKNLQLLKGMGNEVHPLQVYRGQRWQSTTTDDLLPGDLFSLRRIPKNDTIPADCLLVRGTAVVNEATLTGESIPQMKEGLKLDANDEGEEEEVLHLKGSAHKAHVLFGGTKLLTSATEHSTESDEPNAQDEGTVGQASTDALEPPDGGCLCYVLRTGFSSSQGKLVRMIEGSTETVRTDTRDTTLLLLLLLVFAVSSSGYVLTEGMKEGNKRSKYQLLLHCILIITSVIPPELPMQMALAVNSSLMTLMKMQVFCTEPFRIPMAGKVDVCLFDKTGTLTTDELVAVGVAAASNGSELTPMDRAAPPATWCSAMPCLTKGLFAFSQVLAGCHSIVVVDGDQAGDPVESAAMKAIRWEVPKGAPNSSAPKADPPVAASRGSSTTPATQAAKPKAKAPTPLVVEGVTIPSLNITVRHRFSSELQRMTAVVKGGGGKGGWVLVKGSPEAIGMRLKAGARPKTYEKSAARLAKEGMRVLALAYKRVPSEEGFTRCCTSRSAAESDLIFAGFVAFTCRVRQDTAQAVAALKEGAHKVIMVTGDALLTAIHVAKEVSIVLPKDPALKPKRCVLTLSDTESGGLQWIREDTEEPLCPFESSGLAGLAAEYDLATTGKAISKAWSQDPELAQYVHHICVYARMTPEEKERLVLALKDHGHTVLMCGDGANDVGALKQAHVGVALLGGFGDLNVARNDAKMLTDSELASMKVGAARYEVADSSFSQVGQLKSKLGEIGVQLSSHPEAVEKSDLIALYKSKASTALANPAPKAPPTPAEIAEKKRQMLEKRKAMQKEMAEEVQRKTAELQAAGESFAMFKAVNAVWKKDRGTGPETVERNAGRLATMMDEAEDMEVPMVKIGDASVASPFTSKMPSIRGTVDIVRQGRCTLVTSIQMYQILALNCLISAYSLSVLYLDGIKHSDTQMTAMGMLMSVSFITISRSKPLSKLSSVRPLTSVFSPALFLSILGQFVLHLGTMMYAVAQSKLYLPEDYEPDLEGEFEPNIINSVVFLVGAVQQVSVFVVNLKGRPFMGGLSENRPLVYSLAATFALTFMSASETIPRLNKWLKLEPFPNEAFRNRMLVTLAVDIVCSFAWDRAMLLLCAPRILWASFEGTSMKDVVAACKVLAIVSFVIYSLSGMDLEELEGLEGIEESGPLSGAASV